MSFLYEKRHIRGLLSAAMAAMAFQAACGPAGPVQPEPEDDDRPVVFDSCRSDQECPEAQRCEQQLCAVPVQEETLRYGLTILPPSASMIAPQRIPAADWPVNDARVDVDEVLTIALTIESNDAPIDATLVAIPRDDLGATQASVRAGEATLHIAPGDYDLTLVPDSTSLPRYDLGPATFSEDGPLGLEVPGESQLRELRGRLVRRSGLPLDLLDLPVAGARVIGIDPDSRQTTTAAITDALGAFTLLATSDDRVYDLHISPGDGDDLVPVAVFEDAFDDASSRVRFFLGNWLVELLTLTVQLRATGLEEAVDWSDVDLVARTPLGLGELQVPLEVNNDGRASARLLSGTYELSARPHGDSALEGASKTVDLLTALSTELDLSARHRISGQLLDDRGEPVSAARLRFTHLQDERFARTLSTTEDGRWSARLPTGELRVTISPQANSGQPRQVESLRVNASTPTLLWRLAAPALIAGRLSHPEHGTEAITVQLTDPATGEVLAEGRTGAQGRYQLIVPAPALERLR